MRVKSVAHFEEAQLAMQRALVGDEKECGRIGRTIRELHRAEAGRRYLNQTDSRPLHVISVVSYGKTKPVAENSTRKGRAQNRRVVVRVLE